ncbi:hypothetical protein B0J11DRAFT_588657 [Dendryphion nanum]|uniref:Uncharacterized protein n=1 Tax=Dendryphion nanum TaxID=256645 RepID=A0A9P9EKZ3_9PLEO|nr:hypothetical protein B0J11DRAFT_588657 [Dendryphion nanum]
MVKAEKDDDDNDNEGEDGDTSGGHTGLKGCGFGGNKLSDNSSQRLLQGIQGSGLRVRVHAALCGLLVWLLVRAQISQLSSPHWRWEGQVHDRRSAAAAGGGKLWETGRRRMGLSTWQPKMMQRWKGVGACCCRSSTTQNSPDEKENTWYMCTQQSESEAQMLQAVVQSSHQLSTERGGGMCSVCECVLYVACHVLGTRKTQKTQRQKEK